MAQVFSRKFKFGLIIFLSFGVAISILVHYILDVASFSLQKEVYNEHPIGIQSHILFGLLALIFGPLQFSETIRRGHIFLHRIFGYIYAIGVLFSAIAGLYMSHYAYGGWVSTLGFSFLSLGWVLTLYFTIFYILKKKQHEHKKWALRSYALTFSAVTLRIELPLAFLLGHFFPSIFQFDQVYPIISWLCWIPNLIFIEYLISRENYSRQFA